MGIKQELDTAIAERNVRPTAVRLSVRSFNELEDKGHIVRANGGPGGLVSWANNVPFFDRNIFVWCDPAFKGEFELPPE